MKKEKPNIFNLLIFVVLALIIVLIVVFFKQKNISDNPKTNTSKETLETTSKDNPTPTTTEKNDNDIDNSTEKPGDIADASIDSSQTNGSDAKKETATKTDIYAEKYEKAFNLFFANDYEKSISTADEIIAQNPNYYMAYNIKGIATCYKGNFEEGMKNINKSLELNADFPYGRFNKALALELFGYFDEALKAYDKALEVDKSNPWVYYGIASIYGRYGDAENTIKYMTEAIKLDPKVKEEAKTESDFDNVRSINKFNALINS